MSAHKQYNQIKRSVGDYTVSYGVLQSVYDSCDVIDFFKISEQQYGLYLADVAGTGSSSLAVVKELQNLISNYFTSYVKNSSQDIVYPASLLQELSAKIYAEKFGKYLTLLYGVLDLEKHLFNYSMAGHYPNPILLDQNAHAKYLFGKGFPMGILPNIVFENFTTTMKVGSAVVLFSDGIMKFFMQGHDIEVRDNSLLDIICESKAELGEILQKLQLSSDIPIMDDIVIVVIKRVK